jgi:hypothetical protein
MDFLQSMLQLFLVAAAGFFHHRCIITAVVAAAMTALLSATLPISGDSTTL